MLIMLVRQMANPAATSHPNPTTNKNRLAFPHCIPVPLKRQTSSLQGSRSISYTLSGHKKCGKPRCIVQCQHLGPLVVSLQAMAGNEPGEERAWLQSQRPRATLENVIHLRVYLGWMPSMTRVRHAQTQHACAARLLLPQDGHGSVGDGWWSHLSYSQSLALQQTFDVRSSGGKMNDGKCAFNRLQGRNLHLGCHEDVATSEVTSARTSTSEISRMPSEY